MNLTTGRRADEFNRLLQSGSRGDDPVTAPMLAVADVLQELPQAEGPRAEFRDALRQRLMAVAAVQGIGETGTPLQRAREAGSTWRVQKRLTALAAGAAVVTGVAGVGIGASRAIPGDPFYGVKRAAEGAQLATTVGTEDRGKRHLQFARTRLHEVKSLAGSAASLGSVGDGAEVAGARAEDTTHTKLIADTLHDMDVETRAGANDLFAAYRDSGSREPLTALNSFTRQQYSALQALVPALPQADREQARASLTLLAVVATDTLHSAAASTPTTGGSTPTSPSGATPPSAPGSTSQAPGTTNTPTATTSGKGAGGSSGTTLLPSGQPGVSVPSLSVPLVPLPTASVPTAAAPTVSAPAVPTIPSLLPTDTSLPTQLPSIPDVGGLLGQ